MMQLIEIPSSKRSSSEARLLLRSPLFRISCKITRKCTTPCNCCFSNMRLKQHSYVSAQQQFSTSGTFVLRYL